MGPVRIRHSSDGLGWQSSHSVDLAGWQAKMASIEISIGSYRNLRDVQPNPLPERAARGQGMTAVHPADEGLEPRSPMHLRTKPKNGSYMI